MVIEQHIDSVQLTAITVSTLVIAGIRVTVERSHMELSAVIAPAHMMMPGSCSCMTTPGLQTPGSHRALQ